VRPSKTNRKYLFNAQKTAGRSKQLVKGTKRPTELRLSEMGARASEEVKNMRVGLLCSISSKQILQCGMQQRSWPHFRDAVDLIAKRQMSFP